MPTPLFKVLANSIRLGQPPEPVAAIKALVEVIGHLENELADLRQRNSLLVSRLQFLEAKTARLEVVSLQSGPPSSPSPYASDQIVMPQRDPRPVGLSVPHHLPKADPLPSRTPAPAPQNAVPQNAVPQNAPSLGTPSRGVPARGERLRSQMPPAYTSLEAAEESQDEAGGTLVVARADIDAVVRQVVENEAPFPLSPPGGHRPPETHADMPFKPPASVRPPGLDSEEGARHRIVPDRGSISDPYVPIEELQADDTFSSTAEVEAARGIVPGPPPIPPIPQYRPLIVDEMSVDEVLTSVHKRKP